MKIVLDTNVFVSGIFYSGSPYQILKLWHENKIQLVISAEILEEYLRVAEILREDHMGIDLQPVMQYVIQNALIIRAVPLPELVCEDPDDDKFIACALASGSKWIVSGDKHLLKVSGYKGIETLKPREFIERYFGD